MDDLMGKEKNPQNVWCTKKKSTDHEYMKYFRSGKSIFLIDLAMSI
jgi:hypothetical protein